MDDGKVVPLRGAVAVSRPNYADDVIERCYQIWGSDGGGRASRTARLYEQEVAEDGLAAPTERTILRWEHEHGWEARWADEFKRNQASRVYRNQVRWAMSLEQAQRVLQDGMSGELDSLGMAAAARIKSAEVVLRTLEKAGALTVMVKGETEDADEQEALSLEEREAYLRQRVQERKKVSGGS